MMIADPDTFVSQSSPSRGTWIEIGSSWYNSTVELVVPLTGDVD